MSFFKKLFFWTNSNRIRETDIKCSSPPLLDLPYKFPGRNIYSVKKLQTKIYHNQSCSTDGLTNDISVQCEIHDPPIWHKKSSKNVKKKKYSKSMQKTIINDNNSNANDTLAIDITINFPEKPKPLRRNQEFDLSGIEKFIKNSKQQEPIFHFIFDDQIQKIPENKIEVQEISLPIHENIKQDETTHESDKSAEETNLYDFNSNTQNNNVIELSDQQQIDNFDLPEPQGRFVFEFD